MTKHEKEEPDYTFLISIDGSDWNRGYIVDEPDVSTEAAILALVDAGATPGKIGTYLIIAQERGDSTGIIAPNKSLLYTGAATQVHAVIARQKDSFNAGEREFTKRTYIAEHQGRMPQPDEDDPDWMPPRYVRTDSGAAADFARKYLLTKVVGNVRNHLAIIRAVLGRDEMVKAAAELRAKIAEVESYLKENGD